MITVARERVFLTGLRQAYLLSKSNATRLSSRTVLFLHATDEAMDGDNLQHVFGDEARRHWTVTNQSELEELVDNRNDKAMLLESGEVAMSRKFNKRRLQATKKENHSPSHGTNNGSDAGPTDTRSRPTHRLTPLIGEKVDTIHWSRKLVSENAKKVQEARESDSSAKSKHASAIFVEFSTQAAAQRAYQQLTFNRPLHMDPRYIGVVPKEVIWKNLGVTPAARLSKSLAASVFIALTILLWSIPIGFVGAISNIKNLTEKVHFLRFIDNLPPVILGLITGLLPPYLMSTFVSYVPKFFRCMLPNVAVIYYFL